MFPGLTGVLKLLATLRKELFWARFLKIRGFWWILSDIQNPIQIADVEKYELSKKLKISKILFQQDQSVRVTPNSEDFRAEWRWQAISWFSEMRHHPPSSRAPRPGIWKNLLDFQSTRSPSLLGVRKNPWNLSILWLVTLKNHISRAKLEIRRYPLKFSIQIHKSFS